MGTLILGLYAFFAVTSGLNALLLRRPGQPKGNSIKLAILIPARNEGENLSELIPLIATQTDGLHEIWVYDDESTDGTAAVAASLGAKVVRSSRPLPDGWTGKNFACHSLAQTVLGESNADWLVFLDADVRVTPQFVQGVSSLIEQGDTVITGFPKITPGVFPQPVFLGWVGWILISTNPFWIVQLTKRGHNAFTNGQFHAWERQTYQKLKPNEVVRGAILEDVKIGRLCAREGIAVLVANVSSLLSVKMYDTWQETVDGMSKNSFEITGSPLGSIALAALLLFIAWAWTLSLPTLPAAYAFLVLSGIFTTRLVKAKPWGAVLMPVMLTIGCYTILRSTIWHAQGKVKWKGRTYPGRQKSS